MGALDGLRAVAVAAVIAYHLWPDRLPSGFLGVDVFMVLSGFLITGLLVREHERDGRIRLVSFWTRRFRRLVPAAMLLLVTVALWVHATGPRTLAPSVRSQGIAALTYVTNWRLIADGASYGSGGAAQSPLVHLWSLAVEEQFYLLWPVVLVAVLVLTAGRRGWPIALAAIGAIASAVLMVTHYDADRDPLRLYYGTDTRAQAFLIGAVAAFIAPRLRDGSERVARATGAVALVALPVVMLGDTRDGLYRGGFTAVAIGAACVCLAATIPGPVTRCLDLAVLRGVGRVSYGLYLWHWPAIALLTTERVDVHGTALTALRLAVTIAGALASWFLIEQRARTLRWSRLALVGVAAISAAGVAVLTLPRVDIVAYSDFRTDRVPPPVVRQPDGPSAPSATTTSPPTAAPLAPTIALPPSGTAMIVGDSGMFSGTPALSAGLGAAGWEVVETAYPGMGLTRPGEPRTRWADTAREHGVDLTIVMIGGWDTEWERTHGEEAYRAVIDEAVAAFTAGGGRVLWLSELPGGAIDERRFEHLFASLPARYPGVVDYLDIEASLRAPDGGWPAIVDGHRLRGPDGWHLCPDGAAAVTHQTLRHIGLDRTDWDVGPWRFAPEYDDPPGVCRA